MREGRERREGAREEGRNERKRERKKERIKERKKEKKKKRKIVSENFCSLLLFGAESRFFFFRD